MKLTMKEIWKDIDGYEGRYMVSNTGNVFSLLSDKILKESETKDGYRLVSLINKDKSKKSFYVHRIVAKQYCTNDKNYNIVNHKNSIPHDNRSCNLEWCTQNQNVKHGWDTGNNNYCGGSHHFSKLNKNDVSLIRMLTNINQSSLSNIFNVSQPVISDIINNKIWDKVNDGVALNSDYLDDVMSFILREKNKKIKELNKIEDIISSISV